MPALDHFAEYILEQLAALRGVRAGRLFSGTGFKQDDVQFGMVISGTLYFVVDDVTRPKYEALGSHCFSYATRKRTVDVRRYYSVPANIIEDEEALTTLAREAIRIAAYSRSKPNNARASKRARPSAQKKRTPQASSSKARNKK